jgi:hypothetical protein
MIPSLFPGLPMAMENTAVTEAVILAGIISFRLSELPRRLLKPPLRLQRLPTTIMNMRTTAIHSLRLQNLPTRLQNQPLRLQESPTTTTDTHSLATISMVAPPRILVLMRTTLFLVEIKGTFLIVAIEKELLDQTHAILSSLILREILMSMNVSSR